MFSLDFFQFVFLAIKKAPWEALLPLTGLKSNSLESPPYSCHPLQLSPLSTPTHLTISKNGCIYRWLHFYVYFHKW